MELKHIGDYDLIRPLKADASTDTYLAEHRFLKRRVVVKIYPLIQHKERLKIFFDDSFAHPHLIKPLMIEEDDQHIIAVFEPYLDASSQSMNLYDFLFQHELLSEEIILSILTQLASAIDYLKQQGRGFCNLHLFNCLIQNVLKEDLYVGLIDFIPLTGDKPSDQPIKLMDRYFSLWGNRSIEAKEDLLRSYEFRKIFFPPEIHDRLARGEPMNVYAFGVLAYCLLTKSLPAAYQGLPASRRWVYAWGEIIEPCLRTDPAKRPDALKKLMEGLKKVDTLNRVKERTAVQEIVSEILDTPQIKMVTPVQELKPVLKAQELVKPVFDPDPAQIFHTESAIAPYRPQEKEEKEIHPIPTEMVIIQEGEYLRGSNEGARDERPAHQVLLNSYAIDVHPVTNEQFVRFLEAMGGEKDSQNNDLIRLRESRIRRTGGKLVIESGYAKHPVVGVSWYGAIGYAKWVGKRLPTEAEWEVASRSLRADMIYPTGPNIERTHANFFSADTTPVMSYPPNDIGLYDIPGNVYEWCYDWYDYNFYESSHLEPTNPKGPHQGVYRVLRGGCWKSLKDDLRCSHRHRNNPGTVNKTYGFRCAADVQ